MFPRGPDAPGSRHWFRFRWWDRSDIWDSARRRTSGSLHHKIRNQITGQCTCAVTNSFNYKIDAQLWSNHTYLWYRWAALPRRYPRRPDGRWRPSAWQPRPPPPRRRSRSPWSTWSARLWPNPPANRHMALPLGAWRREGGSSSQISSSENRLSYSRSALLRSALLKTDYFTVDQLFSDKLFWKQIILQ